MRKICFILFYLLTSSLSNGQDLTEHFRLLNSTNGLNSNLINCVYKDHNGFLWVGTSGGLSRFDGKNIVNYTHQPNDSNSLVNNTINSICEDDKGRIWVATDCGVGALDVHSNRFSNYLSIKDADTLFRINYMIPSIAYYKRRVYVGLRHGVLSTPTDSIKLRVCSKSDLHFPKNLRCLPNRMYSTKNGLWIATFAGLFYTEDGVSFMNKEYNPKRWPIFDRGIVFSFSNEGDSVTYFGTWRYEGIYRFRYATAAIDSFYFKGMPNILAICKVGDEIWGGTFTRGVLVMELKTGKIRFQEKASYAIKEYDDILVNQVLKDDQGTVFVSSRLGLYYVNPIQAQFNSFMREVDNHGFPPSMPFDIEEDDSGTIWCASFVDGLFSLDPKSNVVKYYKFGDNYNRVWSIHNDSSRLLLGSYSGLAFFDLKTKKLKPIQLPPALGEINQSGIRFIVPNTKDEYWLGMWQQGLLRFNIRNGTYRYFSSTDSLNKLHGVGPGCALIRRGYLLMGYIDHGMISKIDIGTNKVSNFKTEDNGKGYGGTIALVSDKFGNIWAGTLQGGVACFDSTGKLIAEYTSSNGLTNNSIAFLQFDDNGKLWIGTANGLNKLDPVSKKIFTFTYSDGLPSNSISQNQVLKLKDGTIYMICESHLVTFDPAKLSSNANLPKVQVLSIQKSGEAYFQNKPEDVIDVSYNDKIISVEFTAINYIDPDKTQFAYKLEGFDNGWNYSGKRNYASYTNLPPGNYSLKIKATNSLDNWNVPEQVIKLKVNGPFWKTWWFFALCLITTFLLAFSIYYLRLRQILSIQAIRDKISKDLHDDIGSALSSIAIYSEVAKKYSEEKVPEIVSILNSLQETANTAMENMSDIVWSINPLNDRFADTVKRLEIFANELLNARGINTQFTIAESISGYKISMQQRKNIYLICKEAINNVAKYSEAKNCIVEMNDNNSEITINIKDDGKGIEETKQTLGGNGIINMKKRAMELRGLLDIISEKNRGTLLSLRFAL